MRHKHRLLGQEAGQEAGQKFLPVGARLAARCTDPDQVLLYLNSFTLLAILRKVSSRSVVYYL